MMMETGYSTLFSLGLSNIQTTFPRGVSPQPSPVPTPITPSGSHSSMSVSSSAFNLQAPPRIHINTQLTPSRPKLRKRRSSLTVANSPMAGIKSPSRTAGMSFNRAILLSPSKARSTDGVAQESFMQRLRSGSLGSALARSRRGPVRKPAPAPPTLPLPPVPTKEHPPSSPIRRRASDASVSFFAPQGRNLAARRVLGDNSMNGLVMPSGSVEFGNSPNSTYLTPDFALKLAMAMSTPPSSSAPSPVDLNMGRSYFDTFPTLDEEMKEN